MDSALFHSSSKRVRNPKRSTQTRPYAPSRSSSANLSLESSPKMEVFNNGGVLLNPPYPFSHSSSLPRLNSSPNPVQSQQPPLLPLPTAPPPRQFRSLPVASAGGSLSPAHKKHNKGSYKDQANGKTPKSPLKVTVKGTSISTSKQNPDAKPGQVAGVRLGPDPGSLPDLATSLFFPLPPPPSSLPMPKFPMRRKVSCGVEAVAGPGGVRVDAGATDGLCRLLNLR